MSSLFAERWADLKGLTLKQLCLVGAHDSAARAFMPGSQVYTDSPVLRKVNKLPTLLRRILPLQRFIASFAQTQTLGLDALFAAGVRSFDLRVCQRQGALWCHHSLLIAPLAEVLRSLSQILARAPQEFVLVKIQWTDSGETADLSARVEASLRDAGLGGMSVSPVDALLPLGQLCQRGLRAWIYCEGATHTVTIPLDSFASRYFDTNAITAKVLDWQGQLSELHGAGNSAKLFDLQLVLTPQDDDIKRAASRLRLCDNNLRALYTGTCAFDYAWVKKFFASYAESLTCVSLDFVDSSAVSLARAVLINTQWK